MEAQVLRTLRKALKETAPDLYDDLAARGELEPLLQAKAAEIDRQVQSLRAMERWDELPHLDFVRNLNSARARMAREVVTQQLHHA
jgi:hypothetical protein